MKQTAFNLSLLVASAAALLIMSMLPAWANWQARNDTKGSISAQACLSGSPRLCVKLQCFAWKDGGVYWNIDAPEPDYSAESTSVSWTIDGRTLMHLEMRKGWAGDGIQTYEADFDQTAHQGLVGSLKNGKRLTVSSDQFVPFTVSLRGSGTALSQAMADCPLTNAASNLPLPTAPTESFDQPFDAVKALMVAQGCKATETEIFDAITNGGFGIWDANQFIVTASENGTLVLLDKTDGIHKYRLGACP